MAVAGGSVEGLARLLDAALAREAGREPERAGQEGALRRHAVVGVVAAQQAVEVQSLPDRIGRRDHPLVVPFDEADRGQAQQGRVEPLVVEGLQEGAEPLVVASRQDRLVQLVAGARASAPAPLGRVSSAIRMPRSIADHASAFE